MTRCDRYCPANDLSCGNGTIRTPHPIELLGEDWCDVPAPLSEPELATRPLHPAYSKMPYLCCGNPPAKFARSSAKYLRVRLL